MPVGIIVNALSVAIGGMLGALLKNYVKEEIKLSLNMIFGICAMGMGIASIVRMENMPAVVFSVIVGTLLGLLIHLGALIQKGAAGMQKAISGFVKAPEGMDETEFMNTMVMIIVLFCASATGFYGSLVAGISGDHSIMIAKSVLDFFTAMIFGCSMGMIISFIAIPQFILFYLLFLLAKFIYPLTTPAMINDFKAAGGFLLIATGFRMLKLKEFPTADMIPAMILVMPVSWLWVTILLPFIQQIG